MGTGLRQSAGISVQERGGLGTERHACNRARSGRGRAGAAGKRLFRKAGRKFKNVAPVAMARGHRAVAQMVAMGVGDVGVATRSAAASFGLHFEPLAEACFDLVFPAALASDGRVQALLDCLSDGRFRQDLGGMTGYRTVRTGQAFTGRTSMNRRGLVLAGMVAVCLNARRSLQCSARGKSSAGTGGVCGGIAA